MSGGAGNFANFVSCAACPTICFTTDTLAVRLAQKNGVVFAATVRQREKDNPRFGFLLPWNPLHSLYRERAAAVLGTNLATQLFDSSPSEPLPTATTGTSSEATNPDGGAVHQPSVSNPLPEAVRAIGSGESGSMGVDPGDGKGGKVGESVRKEYAVQQLTSAEPPLTAAAAADQQADLDALSTAAAGNSAGIKLQMLFPRKSLPGSKEDSQPVVSVATVLPKPNVLGLMANPSMLPSTVRKKRLWDVKVVEPPEVTESSTLFPSPPSLTTDIFFGRAEPSKLHPSPYTHPCTFVRRPE